MREHLRPRVSPLADASNLVGGEHFRLTVLESGLIRLEYQEEGRFVDQATQAVVRRDFASCPHTSRSVGQGIELETDLLTLRYDGGPPSPEGLALALKRPGPHLRAAWNYGSSTGNLGGTTRTLDEAVAAVPLEDGVLARLGIAVFDDSRTVLLREDGWIEPRPAGHRDLYLFAYGHDYRAALRAFYRLTGPQPLLPRYALGNWWSRYYPYTADEYLGLMDRFRAERIPFSVSVIDMDWHLVDIDPRYGSGWTGYTWNRDLFPDPPAFLSALHDRGLTVSLNIHPAEGVHAHEERYPALARRMGIDPETEIPVRFDVTDPAFLEAYLEELYHPLEAIGVDFWWLDWQQGAVTRIPGLDPLWLLNHFHFLDSARDGRRPLTFSRYAGVGSHRYPVGFSGDTRITWPMFDFLPYFTATAANVGYGWWSHDIGGHDLGTKDDELATRWLQFGVFSPIMRLHSGPNRFISREPWRFGERAERVMVRFLRLRHQLIPYLASMNRRAHEDALPLVRPMYHEHPEAAAAYEVPNQYLFGDQLLVAAITQPADRETGLGAVQAWLPPGPWIDVFTGLVYAGDRRLRLHRDLDTLPVLARAGGILTLAAEEAADFGAAAPDRLQVHVFAGASGEAVLSEDRDDERWAETRISYDAEAGEIRIHPLAGDGGSAPRTRSYEIVLCGFAGVEAASLDGPSGTRAVEIEPGPHRNSQRVSLGEVQASSGARLQLRGDWRLGTNRDVADRLFELLDRAEIEHAIKSVAYATVRRGDPGRAVGELLDLDLGRALVEAMTEILLADSGLE